MLGLAGRGSVVVGISCPSSTAEIACIVGQVAGKGVVWLLTCITDDLEI